MINLKVYGNLRSTAYVSGGIAFQFNLGSYQTIV